jgi:hypothetical protein
MTSNTSNEKMNIAFDFSLDYIEDTIKEKLNGEFLGYDRIIPPRSLVSVSGICLMKESVLQSLIKNIPLRNSSGEKIYPYKYSDIKIFRREPSGFEVGQTFVLKEKVLGLMQNLDEKLFENFYSPGIAKMQPLQFYGIDAHGDKAIAFYIPPIAEIQGRNVVLIDGIHRSYLCRSTGTTINTVHINDVSQPLPFDPISWGDTTFVSEKPPKNERYKNLRMEYFRDLGAIGIDG